MSIDAQSPVSSLTSETGTKVSASSESIDKNKIVEEILELSGMKKQIEKLSKPCSISIGRI